jgi:hypothetical protein
MAATKETLKVKDLNETVKGITGLVKDNYLNGVELTLYLWEENLKALNTQVDRWLNFQQDYIKARRGFYERFPKEVEFWNGTSKVINDEVDLLVAFQKDYIESVRDFSDGFTKETLGFTQKNIEKTLSLFDSYLHLFRV